MTPVVEDRLASARQVRSPEGDLGKPLSVSPVRRTVARRFGGAMRASWKCRSVVGAVLTGAVTVTLSMVLPVGTARRGNVQ
jgi:hypothetical protein